MWRAAATLKSESRTTKREHHRDLLEYEGAHCSARRPMPPSLAQCLKVARKEGTWPHLPPTFYSVGLVMSTACSDQGPKIAVCGNRVWNSRGLLLVVNRMREMIDIRMVASCRGAVRHNAC